MFVVAGALVGGVQKQAVAGVVDGDGGQCDGDGDQSDPADVDDAGRVGGEVLGGVGAAEQSAVGATAAVLRRRWSRSSAGGPSPGPRVAGPASTAADGWAALGVSGWTRCQGGRIQFRPVRCRRRCPGWWVWCGAGRGAVGWVR